MGKDRSTGVSLQESPSGEQYYRKYTRTHRCQCTDQQLCCESPVSLFDLLEKEHPEMFMERKTSWNSRCIMGDDGILLKFELKQLLKVGKFEEYFIVLMFDSKRNLVVLLSFFQMKPFLFLNLSI